jgi:hypothetical protein
MMSKNRFDLEQEILDCWKLVDDVKFLAGRSAKPEDFEALSKVYEHKFNQLWQTFEFMLSDFLDKTPKSL